MIQVNDCDNCIHSRVCSHKNSYNTIIEATKVVAEAMAYDIFELECKCKHFSTSFLSREGVR